MKKYDLCCNVLNLPDNMIVYVGGRVIDVERFFKKSHCFSLNNSNTMTQDWILQNVLECQCFARAVGGNTRRTHNLITELNLRLKLQHSLLSETLLDDLIFIIRPEECAKMYGISVEEGMDMLSPFWDKFIIN